MCSHTKWKDLRQGHIVPLERMNIQGWGRWKISGLGGKRVERDFVGQPRAGG